LRMSGGGANAAESELDATNGRNPASDAIIEPSLSGPVAAVRAPSLNVGSSRPAAVRAGLPEPAGLDLVPNPAEPLAARLDRFEERLEQIARAVDRHAAEIGQELRRARSERAHQVETEEARRDAAMERLRADLLATLTRATADGSSRSGSRRPDVSVDLYARLARLEAASLARRTLPRSSFCPRLSSGRTGTRSESARFRWQRPTARNGSTSQRSPAAISSSL
jgi:hypothetical protein